jgi:hypothetical protein
VESNSILLAFASHNPPELRSERERLKGDVSSYLSNCDYARTACDPIHLTDEVIPAFRSPAKFDILSLPNREVTGRLLR